MCILTGSFKEDDDDANPIGVVTIMDADGCCGNNGIEVLSSFTRITFVFWSAKDAGLFVP